MGSKNLNSNFIKKDSSSTENRAKNTNAGNGNSSSNVNSTKYTNVIPDDSPRRDGPGGE